MLYDFAPSPPPPPPHVLVTLGLEACAGVKGNTLCQEWITKNKFKKSNQPDRRLKKLQNCKLASIQFRQKKKRKQKEKGDQRQAVNELKEEDEEIY